MKRPLILLTLLTSLSLSAQERDPAGYVRILAPAGATPGAFGAQWSTTLLLRNDSDRPIDVYPMNNRDCPVSIGCFRSVRGTPALAARETAFSFGAGNQVPATVGDASPYGFFFYVERGRLDDLTMQLHATDASRTPQEVTQLPLVPETEFFATTRSIVGIRLTRESRVSVRVFQLDPLTPREFTLRIVRAGDDRPLAERRFRFTPGASGCAREGFFQFGCPGDFVHHPGYVLIGDLVREFPELEQAVDERFGIRIEVEPLTGLRYWTMATVTENTTNHVTVYTVR